MTRTRIAAVAAGLAGAVALTACGGGDSKDDSTPAPSGSTASTAGTGDPTAASDALQGSWLATTDGKAVALVITGRQAGLFSTGGSVCSGAAGKEAGMQMIRLTCTDGSKDRATGMVESTGRATLKVTWSGRLGTETYTRAEGGQLPSGLPTANLGS